jgi:malonate transporter
MIEVTAKLGRTCPGPDDQAGKGRAIPGGRRSKLVFTLGVTVALCRLNGVPWDVLVLIKLALHPIVALLLLTAFGPFDPAWVKTAMLMAALPPALSVFVLARQYNAWLEPASASVLIGTLVSVATLTTVMWLVQHGVVDRFLLR